jgi:DNA-binding NarL/FixJ family response regulator
MEWVHCHIARQPVPPYEKSAQVPRALSLITMQLLAKTAEERYQTAAGVEADLRQCLAQWESHGRSDPFPLGAHGSCSSRCPPRERDVFALITAGLLNKRVAAELGASEITVKVHRTQITRKMRTRSLANLVRIADALGIRSGSSRRT